MIYKTLQLDLLPLEQLRDKITENRIKKGWDCILQQFFEYSKKNSIEQGPGINMFKFLRSSRDEKNNCQYLYAEKGGYMWEDIINSSPDKEFFQKKYNPVIMVAICVHVPIGDNGDKTVGNLRLFDINTKEEFSLSMDKKKEDKKYTSSKDDCGLRKRIILKD